MFFLLGYSLLCIRDIIERTLNKEFGNVVSVPAFPFSSWLLSNLFKPSEASSARQLNYLTSVIPSDLKAGIFFELYFMNYYPGPFPLSNFLAPRYYLALQLEKGRKKGWEKYILLADIMIKRNIKNRKTDIIKLMRFGFIHALPIQWGHRQFCNKKDYLGSFKCKWGWPYIVAFLCISIEITMFGYNKRVFSQLVVAFNKENNESYIQKHRFLFKCDR